MLFCPAVAVRLTICSLLTVCVTTLNVAEVSPPLTVTVGGVSTAVESSARLRVRPPSGAGPVSRIVQTELGFVQPPVTTAGETESLRRPMMIARELRHSCQEKIESPES